jgi:hypothetical protein
MSNTRGSLWLRWPNEQTGPLWLGVHLNERAGETVMVGVEVWTEEPGTARASLGPAGDATDDLLPWPAIPIRSDDITGLSLESLRTRLKAVLSAPDGSALVREAAAALRPQRAGRPPLYPPEHFGRVAKVYLRAVEEGSRAPTLAVAQTWNVSRSAAAKWVMRARAAGLLPQIGPRSSAA